ncbi:MAG TPA: DeoR/GlpR family DNA-binding transcription regulator [Propionibacteriaceae bacterium]|nr:DeoR/GlpR family DNA-binding transcription regulator [Propionibacteriaceae bacterium]
MTARHDLIMQWLAAEGRVDVVSAATRLGVAQETVRRDLRTLENSGRLQRVHGGALPVDELPFRDLAPSLASDGNHLTFARLVWAHLPRRGTLLLGASRLTLALAQVINADPPTDSGLTIVTNSLDIAIALAPIRLLSVYNIGGTVSRVTRAQEGDWALQELNRLRVDVSVVCPAGITIESGLGQSTPAAAAVSSAEVACARSVIALAEADVVGHAAFVQFASLNHIDRLMVSGQPNRAALEPFRDRGLDLTVVGDDTVDDAEKVPSDPSDLTEAASAIPRDVTTLVAPGGATTQPAPT